MKNCLIIIFFLIISLGNTTHAQTNDQSPINWLSFEQLSDSLQSNPKKVLLFLHTDWCVYCKKMQKETFQHRSIVNHINSDYYAVQLDAESVEPIIFDNNIWLNSSTEKRKGQYHELVRLLTGNKEILFPAMILFDANFTIKKTTNKYLSIKDLEKILKN